MSGTRAVMSPSAAIFRVLEIWSIRDSVIRPIRIPTSSPNPTTAQNPPISTALKTSNTSATT